MAQFTATLGQDIAPASDQVRRYGASAKYSLDEASSRPPALLVLKKGASAFSWGSTLTVELAAIAAGSTQLTVTTNESFAITDWGRGKRAAKKLFDAIGATSDL